MKSPNRSTTLSPVSACALALLLAVVPLFSGCILAAAGAGAGAVAYVRGELDATLGTAYGKVVDATRVGLKELEFSGLTESKDGLKAEFTARTALDKKVVVIVEKVDAKTTKISIRIGLIGDQQLSIAILDKIKSEL